MSPLEHQTHRHY